jgi:putative transcriptional regulator
MDIYTVNKSTMTNKKYAGHLLVANPNNPRDELSKSVILLVTHTDKLGIGLQLNNPLEEIDLQTVAFNSNIDYPHEGDPLYYGGNISMNKIHVVHSNDWKGLSTVKLNDQISVTNDISVLAALSRGEGPEHFRACAGYWLWENSMLDDMLSPRNKNYPHKWETVPANLKNVFNGEGPDHWRTALDQAAKYQVGAWF